MDASIAKLIERTGPIFPLTSKLVEAIVESGAGHEEVNSALSFAQSITSGFYIKELDGKLRDKVAGDSRDEAQAQDSLREARGAALRAMCAAGSILTAREATAYLEGESLSTIFGRSQAGTTAL